MSASGRILIAVAHGTRDRAGIAVLEELVARVRAELAGVEVLLCYVDVASPSLAEVLARLDRPAVLVPVLLSTGYHVKTDIPGLVAARQDIFITEPIGPDERVSAAALDRLLEACGPLDPAAGLIVVSAGSSELAARDELAVVAGHLASRSGRRVRIAQLTDPDPLGDVDEATAVVNYLLAPGFFADRLVQLAGPRCVGSPIGAHPLLVQVVVERYRTAMAGLVQPGP